MLYVFYFSFFFRKGGRLREPVIVQQIERRTNWMKLLLVLLKDPPMFWFALFSTFQTWFHRSSLSHAVQQSCSRRATGDPRERHQHRCGEREFIINVVMYHYSYTINAASTSTSTTNGEGYLLEWCMESGWCQNNGIYLHQSIHSTKTINVTAGIKILISINICRD